MSITIRDGYRDVEATNSSSGYTVTRTYVVENDDFDDDFEMTILKDSQIPSYGDAYSVVYSELLVSKVTCEQMEDENFKWWNVVVEYSVDDDDDDDDDDVDSDGNFLRNIQISGRSQQYERALSAAYDDDNDKTIPVESTTNEFLSGVSEIYSNAILSISQNLESFSYAYIGSYTNATNAVAMTIAGINVGVDQLKVLDISVDDETDDNGNDYYAVTYTLEIAHDDFLAKPMNQGFMMFDSSIEKKRLILKSDIAEGEEGTDTGKELINEPAKLDEDSQPITGNTAYYLSFKTAKSLDLSALELPTSRS